MLAADLLDAQAPDSPGSLPDTLREQATEAIELVDEAQQYLLTDLLALPQLDCYPVEPRATLAAALGELTASIEERRLRVVIEGPELVSLVLADADALKETLETLAAVLIEDATMDSVLTIRLFEQTKWLTYEWVNQGFGMPDARFQSWLGSDDLTATLLFRRLRVAQRRVSGWQGELTGSSALGEGIRFTPGCAGSLEKRTMRHDGRNDFNRRRSRGHPQTADSGPDSDGLSGAQRRKWSTGD